MQGYAGDSFSSAKGAALKDELQALKSLLKGQVHIVEGLIFRLAESFGTGITAIALRTLSIFAMLFRFDLAVMTNHFLSPCLSLAIGSESGLLEGRCEQSRWFFNWALAGATAGALHIPDTNILSRIIYSVK